MDASRSLPSTTTAVVAFDYLGSTILVVILSRSSFIAQHADSPPPPGAEQADLPVPGASLGLTQPRGQRAGRRGRRPGPARRARAPARPTCSIYCSGRCARARRSSTARRTRSSARWSPPRSAARRPAATAARPTPSPSLPVASLLAEVGPGGRAACYSRAGLARSVALSVVAGRRGPARAGPVARRVGALGVLLAVACVAAGAALPLGGGARALARSRRDRDRAVGARWPAPAPSACTRCRRPASRAEPEPPPVRPTHPIFEQLVRERRRRGAPWRAPRLRADPGGQSARARARPGAERRRPAAPRCCRCSPRSAAAPRALVAISRWSAVEAVCRPDSDRRALVRLGQPVAWAAAATRR